MSTMLDVYTRVQNWNAARYDRVYDQPLAVRLLNEELDEFFTGKSEVDRLDALVDTAYVALGVIWKLDVLDAAINRAAGLASDFQEALPELLTYAAYAKACVHSMEYGAPPLNMAMTTILLCQCEAMSSLGLTEDEWIQACMVVCDSNDSKSVKRVAADVKANDNDKGSTFVPPEPRLAEILRNRKNQ